MHHQYSACTDPGWKSCALTSAHIIVLDTQKYNTHQINPQRQNVAAQGEGKLKMATCEIVS